MFNGRYIGETAAYVAGMLALFALLLLLARC